MKIIFLTIAYAYVVLGASTTKEYPEHRHTIIDAVEEKCYENSHNKNAFVHLYDGVGDYLQCHSQTLNKDPPHPVDQHDEFCRYFEESGYYSCMENLASNVLPCLDNTETFLPGMILKAYNTTFNKLCGTNGVLYTEYIFNKVQRNQECLKNASRTIMRRGYCIQNLTVYKNYEQQIVDLNQHDFCNDMKSFVDCASEIIEQSCKESFRLIISQIANLFPSECKKPKISSLPFIRF